MGSRNPCFSVFQSTLSMRRATWAREPSSKVFVFQSTLSMRRATDRLPRIHRGRPISIHALHEESDTMADRIAILGGISIHALHEESDRLPQMAGGYADYFNPRSP